MPDLSACYFCGAAADAPVREYDVVPDAADESLRSTATLCDGCRSKLETVLSSVVRGARPSDEPVDAELSPANAPADAADSAAGSTPSLDVETEDILAAADRGREETDAASSTGGDDTAAAAGDADAASSSAASGAAGEDSTDAQSIDGIAFDDGADGSTDTAVGADEEADPAPVDDAGLASTSNDADPASTDDAAASGSTSASSDGAGTASTGGAADADIERPDSDTYNRVVRLLQNREFPVNRSEFSELASSAYDIPADECATVIDYAIHRGELIEDRGMLKKP